MSTSTETLDSLSLVMIPMHVAKRLGMAAVVAGGWIGAGEVDFLEFNGEQTIAYIPLSLLRPGDSRRLVKKDEAEKIAASYTRFASKHWRAELGRGGLKRAGQIRQAIADQE